jgi:phage terminase large subunit
MGRIVDIPLIPAFAPLLASARYKGVFGGRGGAKSHGLADLLIERCLMYAGTRAVCIREYQTTLEQSVKRLLEDKIIAYGLEHDFRIMTTSIGTPGDGVIIFQGMQAHNADSIKSLEGYDVAWVEEAQNLSRRSLDLLRPTIRKDATLTHPKSELWFSWNPQAPTDPVDELLRQHPPDDAVVVRTSWRDNPYFPAVLKAELTYDQHRDREKYLHVWEGEYQLYAAARVFTHWHVEYLPPPDNTIFYHGADWGFAVDPSVLVRVWFRDDKTLVVDAEAYQVGCEIDQLPALFDTVPDARAWSIRADNARPETISYMRAHGYPGMIGANKGIGSVKEGIIFLQSYNIVVNPACVHTIDELSQYAHVIDKRTGAITPLLADKHNHVIDALRYAVEEVRMTVDSWVVA